MRTARPEGEGEHQVPADRETAATRDDKIELRLWLRLLTCSSLIERRVRLKLRHDFAITLPKFDLLSQLDRAADGLTMGQLSDRLMVTNGNVTGLTDRLVNEGLVSRHPSPDDRRAQLVRLTAAGKKTFDAVTPEHETWVAAMMKHMDRGDLSRLLELLAELKESLQRTAHSDPN